MICNFFNSMLNSLSDLIWSWEPCSTVLSKITPSACAWYVNIHFWDPTVNPFVKIMEQSNLGQIIINTCNVKHLFHRCRLKMHNGQNLKSRASVLKPRKFHHDQFSMDHKMELLFYWLLNSHGSTIILSNFIDPQT